MNRLFLGLDSGFKPAPIRSPGYRGSAGEGAPHRVLSSLSGFGFRRYQQSSRGAALISGLVALLLLTIIGVAGMQVSTLEERMASNARRRDIAFQAAESALRAGENWLHAQAAPFNRTLFDCGTACKGLYRGNCVADSSLWESLENNNDWGNATKAKQVADWPGTTKPSYVVEEVQRGGALNDNLEVPLSQPDAAMYRITARGVGPGTTPDAFAVVQSTFKKPR